MFKAATLISNRITYAAKDTLDSMQNNDLESFQLILKALPLVFQTISAMQKLHKCERNKKCGAVPCHEVSRILINRETKGQYENVSVTKDSRLLKCKHIPILSESSFST